MDVSSTYRFEERNFSEEETDLTQEEFCFQDEIEQEESFFYLAEDSFSKITESFSASFLKITDCFSSCISCCGEDLKLNFVEDDRSNFLLLTARAWWNPKPYLLTKNGEWIRSFHILFAGLSVINTVVKMVFTVISIVPGSSSELIKEIINVDKWANKGFGKNLGSKKILPYLFTALAVTVNPYASMRKDVGTPRCLAHRVFDKAIGYAMKGIVNGGDDLQYSDESGVKEMLQRNVVSRFLFLTATVLLVSEKIVHLAIGVILTGCSIATLFRDEDLNTQARKYLSALDVVDEVCVGLRAVLYPWQNLGLTSNDSVYAKNSDLSKYRDPLPSRASQVEGQ